MSGSMINMEGEGGANSACLPLEPPLAHGSSPSSIELQTGMMACIPRSPQDLAGAVNLDDSSNVESASTEQQIRQDTVKNDLNGHLPSLTQIPETARLQKIMAEASLTVFETEVQNSLRALRELKAPMTKLAKHDIRGTEWTQQIESLQTQPIVQPTVIGVIGNTGAGKSSLINALLDEERLVPTNCMRACTAVVTSLAWNECDDANARFRAEIEFIQPEDWEQELNVLSAEILDAAGNISTEINNADSEAGVAYSKIKAVYPDMSKDEIRKSSVADMMLRPAVASVLGSTLNVDDSDAGRFYQRLQHYVDSKEKVTKVTKKGEKNEMEFWPLIKIVKIYTKSDALSTGAVVVDLPGVHDSNAARAQVAQNFIKQCTGLWIVAPINRAVDDKAAQSLLGESFKRQLKLDGTYSRVSFICSKTDDISITEAWESVGSSAELSPKGSQVDEITSRLSQLQKRLDELTKTKSLNEESLGKIDDDLETWEKLKDELEDGKVVFEPVTKKRKRPLGNSFKSRKDRLEHLESNVDDDSDASDEGQSIDTDREPLSEKAIITKIAGLRTMKKDSRVFSRELNSKLSALRVETKNLKLNKDKLEADMNAICINGRNNYSRGAIQQDFAAGIKELDQENANEEDADNFNPDEDIRDYGEVAQSLPVFCVSSRAYQKLSGRLKRDRGVPGFNSLEETEVPQLQAHCKKLTEAPRIEGSRRFLNSFSQLCNSLALWSSNDDSRMNPTDAEMALEEINLESALASLSSDLETAVGGCITEMKECLSVDIYDKFKDAVTAAVMKASATSAKWSSPINKRNRSAGGLYWNTYKAVVIHNGVYDNAQGLHDFNAQLINPLLVKLASNWEKVFTRSLPEIFAELNKTIKTLLETFHHSVEARATINNTRAAALSMLKQQLQNCVRIFQDHMVQTMSDLIMQQREANRTFKPVIAKYLANAYALSAAEAGPGSYARMAKIIKTTIEQEKNTMFSESAEEVSNRLGRMCDSVEDAMTEKAEEVSSLIRRDYLTAITGSHMPQGQEIPQWRFHIMVDVLRILAEIDKGDGVKTEERLHDTEAHSSDTAQDQKGPGTDTGVDVSPAAPVVDVPVADPVTS